MKHEPFNWKRYELKAAGRGIHTIVLQAAEGLEISTIKMTHTAGPWLVHQILLARRMLLGHSVGISIFEASGLPFSIVCTWRLLGAGLCIEFELENMGDELGDVTVEIS